MENKPFDIKYREIALGLLISSVLTVVLRLFLEFDEHGLYFYSLNYSTILMSVATMAERK
jgi:hypothetical protein